MKFLPRLLATAASACAVLATTFSAGPPSRCWRRPN